MHTWILDYILDDATQPSSLLDCDIWVELKIDDLEIFGANSQSVISLLECSGAVLAPQLGVRSKCNVNVWKVFTFWRIRGPLWAARNWWVGLLYSQYSHLTVPAAAQTHWYVHVRSRPKWTNYEYFPLRRHIWARRDHLGPAGGWPSQSPLGSKAASTDVDSRILCFIIPEICPNWSREFSSSSNFWSHSSLGLWSYSSEFSRFSTFVFFVEPSLNLAWTLHGPCMNLAWTLN